MSMTRNRTHYFCFLIWSSLMLCLSFSSFGQRKRDADLVIVDRQGVMRWSKTGVEVQGFGINYTVPFAHAYRAAKELGVSHREAIDNDVYHFARLGFDAYRVHVWDTEISDSTGNLLDNEHLQLFDYMLKKMKDRGMKFILTPIAFWGNGYPEPDEKTPGFSHKYGKADCLVNEEAIKAQEKYLFQFLNHVNPHTGIAYKNDPDIIAFEISNEPHHNESSDRVTSYINRMVNAMRKSQCQKPIFYNISHSIHLVDAYFKAAIQGGTFQWYPTGLGARKELGGNLLPNVDRYTVPFRDHPKFKKSAKIVYEFDAADVGRSYIYPAMARSFRQAGIQWAAHFSYDPTFMAYANTEYNTHYMNLVYTPQKALSLKIAGEVFHNIPMYKDFGAYPANTKFGDFSVSYEKDLAEMITQGKFIYTNNTASVPPAPEKLEEIAGFGNSSVASYEGTGAYFLDKLDDGIWRLEVLPDALWIDDPFGRNSLKRQVAIVNWRQWPMSIRLPNLGKDFSVQPVSDDNSFATEVKGQTFSIFPGTYLVTRSGISAAISPDSNFKNLKIKEFTAPASNLNAIHVIHTPSTEIQAGSDYTLEATIASPDEPEMVEVSVFDGFRPKVYKMTKTHGYRFAVTIPAEEIKEGYLRYFISVKGDGKSITFPGVKPGDASSWDFDSDRPYEVRVVPRTAPIFIFDARSDNNELSRPWTRESNVAPAEPGKAEVRINIEKLFILDPENPKAEKIRDYSMRYFFGDNIAGRKGNLGDKTKLIFRGRSMTTGPFWVQLALIKKDGTAFGGKIKIETSSQDYSISLSELQKVKVVTLPRPYPTFLPYFFEGGESRDLNIDDVETLQISIGPGIPETNLENNYALAIESVRLE